MTILSGFILMIFAFSSGPLIKKFGRKSILIVGTFLCALSEIILGVMSVINHTEKSMALTYLIIIMIFIYYIFFSLSLGPIVWIYNADILPEKGLGIATFFNWIGSFTVSLLFPVLLKGLGANGFACMFFIFAGFCILGMIFMIIFMIETKGLSAAEIENAFMNGGDNSKALITSENAKSAYDED
jgi:MFS family permease